MERRGIDIEELERQAAQGRDTVETGAGAVGDPAAATLADVASVVGDVMVQADASASAELASAVLGLAFEIVSLPFRMLE